MLEPREITEPATLPRSAPPKVCLAAEPCPIRNFLLTFFTQVAPLLVRVHHPLGFAVYVSITTNHRVLKHYLSRQYNIGLPGLMPVVSWQLYVVSGYK